ncbi:YDG domain-containing protein [Caproicibacterium sp. BJN0003]|uniref:YDG domain-containing protein n=1 Tax=Caproicibacterium sp. BJN0003 TaxID=2994078 RepID=UPI00224FB790|nr:YDG domain-containing protein [Caproicibacterium sp. BJN0003]UZT81303.1 YDG domain-containing protein [Caproicibacterium sp. BJN0003]
MEPYRKSCADGGHDRYDGTDDRFCTGYCTIGILVCNFFRKAKDPTYYTVEFYADEAESQLISSQQIEKGGTALEPRVSGKDGYCFTGWDQSFSNITENLKIHAQYRVLAKYKVTINYVFGDGTMASPSYVAEVEQGKDFTANVKSPAITGFTPDRAAVSLNVSSIAANVTEKVTYTSGMQTYTVKHLFQNEEGTDYIVNDSLTQTLSGEAGNQTDAKAKTVEGFTPQSVTQTSIAPDGSTIVEIFYDRNQYTLSYDTDGGSYIDPVIYRYGQAIAQPQNPTKTGYEFDGWNESYSTMPAQDITLTSKWKATEVKYTVVYWKENADDDGYSYDSKVERSGLTGTDADYDALNEPGFELNQEKTDESAVTVSGEGTTIRNVYYQRKTYTLTFEIYKNSWWSGSWQAVYTHTDIKYQQSLQKWWDEASAQNSDYLWYTSKHGDTFYTAAPTMPEGGLTVYGQKSDGSSTIYYYEYGTDHQIHDPFEVKRDSDWNFTNEDFIDLPGFTYNSNRYGDSDDYYIYYTRNSYDLEFITNGGPAVGDVTSIPYEQDISNQAPQNYQVGITTKTENGRTLYFAGWYDNEALAGDAYTFEGKTMPAKDLLLYAKWVPKQVTVTFDTLGGTQIDSQTFTAGGTAQKPEDPIRGTDTFKGWTRNGVPFSFSTQIIEDTTLRANYSTNTTDTYTIKYVDADDPTKEIAPSDTGSGQPNSTVTVSAKAIDGYQPVVTSTSVVLNRDQIEIKLAYKKLDNWSYTIHYKDTSGTQIAADTTGTSSAASMVVFYQAIGGYQVQDTSAVLTKENHEYTFVYDKMELYSVYYQMENLDGSYTTFKTLIGNQLQSAPEKIPTVAYDEKEYTPNANNPQTISGGVQYVKFDLRSYTITYHYNSVDGEIYKTDSYKVGQSVTAEPMPAEEGYHFSGWFGMVVTMPSNNVDVYCSRAIDQYTVNFAVKSGSETYGSLDKSSATVDYQNSLKSDDIPTTLPNNECYFVEWQNQNGQKVTVDEMTSAKVTGNTTYYAVFSHNGNMNAGVSAPNVVKTYDGHAYGIAVALSGDAEGADVRYMDENGNYTLTQSPSFTHVKRNSAEGVESYAVSYQVTKDHYTAYYGSATVTINPAVLTAAYHGKTINYADLESYDPQTDVVVSGFVNHETASTALEYTAPTVIKPTVSGSHTLMPSGGKANDYNFQYESGTLTVDQAQRNLTVTGGTFTYDGNEHGVTYEITPVSGATDEIFYSTDGTTWQSDPIVQKDVGSVTVYVEAKSSDPNYAPVIGSAAVTINPKPLTGTFTARKTYDGTAEAKDFLSKMIVTGAVSGDEIQYNTDHVTAVFDNQNAGSNKALTIEGVELSGDSAKNYTLSVSGTGVIDPKELSVSAYAEDKVYDGSTNAKGTFGSLQGIIGNDQVTVSGGNFQFEDKNVGTDKTVAVNGITLSGNDCGNYFIKGTASATANITAKELALIVSADNKSYDGTTHATGAVTVLDRIIGEDDAAFNFSKLSFQFDTADVGTDKEVTISGITLDGKDAGNYVMPEVLSTKANITPLLVTANIKVSDKEYDGNTNAAIESSEFSASDRVKQLLNEAGVTINTENAEANFSDKNVGEGKMVAVTGIALANNAKGDFALISAEDTTTANITAKPVTIAITAADKPYDGNQTATLTGASCDGLIQNDQVEVSWEKATATFDDEQVGTNKTVTAHGVGLIGSDAKNYQPTVETTEASITKRALKLGTDVVLSAKDKIYDSTVNADGVIAFNTMNLLDSDKAGGMADISKISVTADFAFADKNQGTDKTVNVTNIKLGGSSAGNYELLDENGNPLNKASITATINPRPVTITVNVDSKPYDGTTDADGKIVSVDGILDNEVTASLDSLTFVDPNAGTDKDANAVITLKKNELGNYILNPVAAKGIITKLEVTLTLTPIDRPYDGTNVVEVTASHNLDEVKIGNDDVALSNVPITGNVAADASETAKEVSFASNPTLTGAQSENYTLTVIKNPVVISKRSATIVGETESKVYSGSEQSITTAKISDETPLVSGQTLSGYSYSAKGTDKGVYKGTFQNENTKITENGTDVTENYSIEYVPGTLSIEAKLLTAADISLQAENKIYDGSDEEPKYTLTVKTVDGEKVQVEAQSVKFSDKDVSYDGGNVVDKDVTAAGLKLIGDASSNYQLSIDNITAKAKITPAKAAVSADSKTKTYGDSDPELTATVTGTIPGETLEYSLSRDPGEDAQTYGIHVALTGSSAVPGNYQISTQDSTLTIYPYQITEENFKFKASDKVYDGNRTAPQYTITVKDLPNQDQLTAAAGDVLFNSANVDAAKEVEATHLNLSGAAAKNYQLPETLTLKAPAKITPTKITIIGHSNSFVYNGTEQTVSGADVTGILEGYRFTVNPDTLSVKRTDVGTTQMGLTDSMTYDIYNVASNSTNEKENDPITGAVMTSYYRNNYRLSVTDGAITITAAPVIPPVVPPVTPPTVPPTTPTINNHIPTGTTPNGATPVAPAPAPAPEIVTEGTTTVPDQNPPAAQKAEKVQLQDSPAPKAAPTENWALLNLIFCILTVLGSVALLLTFFFRKKKEEESRKKEQNQYIASSTQNDQENKDQVKRHGVWRFISLIPSVGSIIAFVLTENMSNPMAIFDQWTVMMAVIAVIQVAIMILSKKRYDKEDHDNDQKRNANA